MATDAPSAPDLRQLAKACPELPDLLKDKGIELVISHVGLARQQGAGRLEVDAVEVKVVASGVLRDENNGKKQQSQVSVSCPIRVVAYSVSSWPTDVKAVADASRRRQLAEFGNDVASKAGVRLPLDCKAVLGAVRQRSVGIPQQETAAAGGVRTEWINECRSQGRAVMGKDTFQGRRN